MNGSRSAVKKKSKTTDVIFSTVAEIFMPLSPAVTAAGILKAILAVTLELNVISADSFIYSLVELIAESPLYYLPLLLAYSCAKRFRCNIPCALAVGGMLIHPDIFHLLSSLGDSVAYEDYSGNYSFSVFPIIISVMFMSVIEFAADKIKLKPLKFFLKPALSLSVTGIFALGLLGPLGLLFSECISKVISVTNSAVPWLAPTLVGGFYPLMMLTGTHYSLVPVGINNIIGLGSDRFVGPGMLVSNIAQSGASLASAIMSKNAETRRYSLSSSMTAMLGIVEPAMYGVNIKRRGRLLTVVAAGGVAGFLMGVSGVERYATATPGIIALTGYIGDDGYENLINTVIAVTVAFLLAFLGTIFLSTDIRKLINEGEQMGIFKHRNKTIQINSPLSGKTVKLSQVSDPIFAGKILGDGVAILPTVGELFSPLDGVIESIAETNHAIAVSGDNGVQMLIHIGIDTVELKGEPFSVKVSVGERVKSGQLLISFDIDQIKTAGYDTLTPIIITNSDSYTSVSAHDREVTVGAKLLELTE